MKKNIYIFVSKSYQPNLYINILGSCIEAFNLSNIEDIYLLKLEENTQKDTNQENEKITSSQELRIIRENILTQLNALCNSTFKLWNKQKDQFETDVPIKSIQIKEDHLFRYRLLQDKIYEDEIRYKVIKQSELEQTLNRIISNPSYEFIFDLTGIPKKDFLRISLILLSKNCSIYIFESLRRFTHDEKDMIHHLFDLQETLKGEASYKHHHLNPQNYKVVRNISETHLEKMKRNWKSEITKDRTDKVLKEITSFLERSAGMDIDLQKEMVNLSRRNHETNEKYKKNILSKAEYDIEVNKINDALIDVIYKIE